jgi:hypothetical protein
MLEFTILHHIYRHPFQCLLSLGAQWATDPPYQKTRILRKGIFAGQKPDLTILRIFAQIAEQLRQ